MAELKVASALQDLAFLAGEWEMELSEADFLPHGAVVTGSATFEFLDDGRLLAFRQGDAATWIIGRDDESAVYTVLYGDSRSVSRVYAMTLLGDVWTIWRDHHEFAQRFQAVITPEAISGRWEKRVGGAAWEHDFAVTYRRLTRDS